MQLKLWFFAGHESMNPESGEGDEGDIAGAPNPVFTGSMVVVTDEVEVVVVLMQSLSRGGRNLPKRLENQPNRFENQPIESS